MSVTAPTEPCLTLSSVCCLSGPVTACCHPQAVSGAVSLCTFCFQLQLAQIWPGSASLHLPALQLTRSCLLQDVTTFLAWAAEPEHDERKLMGVKFIMVLTAAWVRVAHAAVCSWLARASLGVC